MIRFTVLILLSFALCVLTEEHNAWKVLPRLRSASPISRVHSAEPVSVVEIAEPSIATANQSSIATVPQIIIQFVSGSQTPAQETSPTIGHKKPVVVASPAIELEKETDFNESEPERELLSKPDNKVANLESEDSVQEVELQQQAAQAESEPAFELETDSVSQPSAFHLNKGPAKQTVVAAAQSPIDSVPQIIIQLVPGSETPVVVAHETQATIGHKPPVVPASKPQAAAHGPLTPQPPAAVTQPSSVPQPPAVVALPSIAVAQPHFVAPRPTSLPRISTVTKKMAILRYSRPPNFNPVRTTSTEPAVVASPAIELEKETDFNESEPERELLSKPDNKVANLESEDSVQEVELQQQAAQAESEPAFELETDSVSQPSAFHLNKGPAKQTVVAAAQSPIGSVPQIIIQLVPGSETPVVVAHETQATIGHKPPVVPASKPQAAAHGPLTPQPPAAVTQPPSVPQPPAVVALPSIAVAQPHFVAPRPTFLPRIPTVTKKTAILRYSRPPNFNPVSTTSSEPAVVGHWHPKHDAHITPTVVEIEVISKPKDSIKFKNIQEPEHKPVTNKPATVRYYRPSYFYPVPSTSTETKIPVIIAPTPAPQKPEAFIYGFVCKEGSGFYAIENECDSYIECKLDEATKYWCPDGLHFNPNAKANEYPCAYPSEVQCKAGSELQIASPTGECPRQYGTFPYNDVECGKYIICQNGFATVMNCPAGLVYNPALEICDYVENVPQCNPDVFKDYACPEPPLDEHGLVSEVVYKYKYGQQCKLYIACQKGYPRLLSCENDQSFDEQSQSCVDAAYVSDCVSSFSVLE